PASFQKNHLLVLTQSSSLLMYKIGEDAVHKCMELHRFRSREDVTLRPISITVGLEGPWGWATVFGLLENGDVISLCPVIPYPCQIPFNVDGQLGDLLKMGASDLICYEPPELKKNVPPAITGPYRIKEDSSCFADTPVFIKALSAEKLAIGYKSSLEILH